jgi:ketosteroid isomerase-like protein
LSAAAVRSKLAISLTPSKETPMPPDLSSFLAKYHDALDAFFRGDSGPVKPLFSHTDQVTLANPFGPVAIGWEKVEETMDRAAQNYRDGGVTGFETLATCVTSEMAYVVEVESFQAKLGGEEQAARGSLRVTSILRPQEGDWRVVHRHADPITTARPAQSVVQ